MLGTIFSLITTHWAIAGGIGTLIASVLPFAGTILSGGATVYIKLGAYALAALLLFGSGFYVAYKMESGAVATVQAQISAATAQANAKALKDEQAYQTKANAYIAQAQKDVQAAQANEANLRKVLNAQPKSYACTRSPAFTAWLNAMRSSGGN